MEIPKMLKNIFMAGAVATAVTNAEAQTEKSEPLDSKVSNSLIVRTNPNQKSSAEDYNPSPEQKEIHAKQEAKLAAAIKFNQEYNKKIDENEKNHVPSFEGDPAAENPIVIARREAMDRAAEARREGIETLKRSRAKQRENVTSDNLKDFDRETEMLIKTFGI